MPPISFLGSGSRCKEHNNSVWWSWNTWLQGALNPGWRRSDPLSLSAAWVWISSQSHPSVSITWDPFILFYFLSLRWYITVCLIMLTQSFHCSKCDVFFLPVLLPSTRCGIPCAVAVPRVLGCGGFPWEDCWWDLHLPVWDAEGRVPSTAAGSVCLCKCTAGVWVSWAVALWIFLFSKKLGGAVSYGYCFGKWSHRNIYEDCGVLRPRAYPLFPDSKLSKVLCSIHGHPCFSFKGTERICFVPRIKI